MEKRKFYLNKDLICRMEEDFNVCILNKNGTKVKDVLTGEVFQRGTNDLPLSELLYHSNTYVYNKLEEWISFNGRGGLGSKEFLTIANVLAPIIEKPVLSLGDIEKIETIANQLRAENRAGITKTMPNLNMGKDSKGYMLTDEEMNF